MRLTERTDYAFRVLMYLAANGGRLATVGGIAARYGISRNHVARVVWELGRASHVETVRGRGGGLRLAHPAAAIRVGEVARLMERGVALAECFPGGAGACRIESCCALKGILAEAEAAFFAVLDRHSVDDLVRGNRELRAFLLADAAEPADGPSSDARSYDGATVPRLSTSGHGTGIPGDRRAGPDSRSARRR